jgi:hypothetical protein
MILQSALLVMAASAFQAPTPEPAWPSALPPDCGLTDEQVLVMAIPKYHELLAREGGHDLDSYFDDHFETLIPAAVQTDLGFRGRSFLIVAVSVRHGWCDACFMATLMVIDLPTRTVVWRFDSEVSDCYIDQWDYSPEEDGPILRVFQEFPDIKEKAVAFRFGVGHGESEERWYRPTIDEKGSLSLNAIWTGPVTRRVSGDGKTWETSLNSEMRSLWPRRGYALVRHHVTGWYEGGSSGPSVDLMTIQEFMEDPHNARLVPGARTMARQDQGRPLFFPFNLPIANLVFDPGLLPAERTPGGPSSGKVVRGGLIVERVKTDVNKDIGLGLYRAPNHALLREISPLASPKKNIADNEYVAQFGSIGWNRDGSRLLVVVWLPLRSLPPVLVSLTPDSRDDRWEGFLPEGRYLYDGFLVDLPAGDPKPQNGAATPTR